MSTNSTFLIIGACGCGKTWIMNKIIKKFNLDQKAKLGLFTFQTNGKLSVMGNYDGSVFQGSDKLSMGIMADCDKMLKVQKKHGMIIVCEGDRFTNSTFIKKFTPFIIKISNDGKEGRDKRGSTQSERHLKSISTRVKNIRANVETKNSTEALNYIINKLELYEEG